MNSFLERVHKITSKERRVRGRGVSMLYTGSINGTENKLIRYTMTIQIYTEVETFSDLC